MAILKVVIRAGVVFAALEVAASVAFLLVAFSGIVAASGEEGVIVNPTS